MSDPAPIKCPNCARRDQIIDAIIRSFILLFASMDNRRSTLDEKTILMDATAYIHGHLQKCGLLPQKLVKPARNGHDAKN